MMKLDLSGLWQVYLDADKTEALPSFIFPPDKLLYSSNIATQAVTHAS